MILAVLVISLIVAGCGGPDQKKLKFYNKGKVLYEKGDYVKARLEFKNAAQIDPKYSDAYYMLGLTALKQGNLREAYGSLSKAVDLAPSNTKARIELAGVLLREERPTRPWKLLTRCSRQSRPTSRRSS